jgi:ATP-binding cassette subfamily C (CFTR/MRP) protein 1
MVSPVLAFAIFVGISRHDDETLNISRLFTSLSLLLLLSQPLFSTFATFMELVSAVGCFERVESFLSTESRADARLMPHTSNTSSSPLTGTADMATDGSIEMENMVPVVSVTERSSQLGAINICNGTFGWSPDGAPCLQGINLTIPRSKLTVLIGPVASGKSTLLKAILGETPVSKGDVNVISKDIAWCEQAPWLIVSLLYP